MQTFGYLEKRSPNTEGPAAEALYKEDAIVDAIKKIQLFGGIPQNGLLDNRTMELFSAPRCGVPDIMPKNSRSKRYVVGSGNWLKRKITYL
jgi:hypothetical protein